MGQNMNLILRLKGSEHYTITRAEYSKGEIQEIKGSLIPNVELVGLGSETAAEAEIAAVCKEVKIRQPVVGARGEYSQNKKRVEIGVDKMGRWELVQFEVVVNVWYSQEELNGDLIAKTVEALKGRVQLVRGETIARYQNFTVGDLADVQLIVPKISLSKRSSSRYCGVVPVVFQARGLAMSREKIIDNALFDLARSLEFILRFKLPYRIVEERDCFATQDFVKVSEKKRARGEEKGQEKEKEKEEEEEPAKQTKQSKETKAKVDPRLVAVLVCLVVFYVAYRVM